MITNMVTQLLTFGAVPFNMPADSIANRRRRKNSATPEIQELSRMVAGDTAEAINFILGPNYRPGPSSSLTSPVYILPEKMVRCPPNTPENKNTFDFDSANDADCSSADDEEVRCVKNKNRKRKRLISFSNSAASTRRVPHKKTASETTETAPLDSIVPRLHFYQDVQEVVRDDVVDMTETDEEKWRRMGQSLRNIADNFGQSQADSSSRDCLDMIPNGVWAAVFKYVFWKFFKGFK